MSVLSFPDRGKWGKASWRGNCSGHVYRELFEQFRPRVFVDPMVGSGTSIEVAQEMGIEAYGLDLHSGFNILRHRIIDVVGKESDLVVSHPAYAGMIRYSGSVWGSAPHPDDLSHCKDDEDFHEKLQLALLNQREATVGGGHYGTIIGDWRREGQYTSYQAECIARMPKSELAAVLIKMQHNTVSDRRDYARMKYPRIQHEYILLWQKPRIPLVNVLCALANQQDARLKGTWRVCVRLAMMALGGNARLDDLYAEVIRGAPERVQTNPNWQAKVRQTLQLYPADFSPVSRGVWSLAG